MERKYSEQTDKILIFTTFWDADYFLKNNEYSLCKVYSIALQHPNLPFISKKFNPLPTLDFFCPTWEMLSKYKTDKNWDDYTKKYRALLMQRKKEIKEWFNSLKNGSYMLCCWENTSRGANCHRKLLYDVFVHSKSTKDKAVYIYRHGGK